MYPIGRAKYLSLISAMFRLVKAQILLQSGRNCPRARRLMRRSQVAPSFG